MRTGESLVEACKRGIREKVGLDVVPNHKLTSFDHQYSHFRITVHVFMCTIALQSRIGEDPVDLEWLSVSELDEVSMHRSSRRISTFVANERLEPLTSVDVH